MCGMRLSTRPLRTRRSRGVARPRIASARARIVIFLGAAAVAHEAETVCAYIDTIGKHWSVARGVEVT